MAKLKKNIIKLDLSNVDSRLNLYGYSGRYSFVINQASFGENNAGDDIVTVKASIIDTPYPQFKDKIISIIFNQQPQTLWVFRQFLEALEVEIPSGPFELDLEDLAGFKFTADVEDNVYDDKKNHRVKNFNPYQEEIEEETPQSVKKETTNSVKEESPKSEKTGGETKVNKPEEKSVDYNADDIMDMDVAELEDLVKKYKLDIDLSEYVTLRKKHNVVIEALTQKGLLNDD